MTTFVAKSEDKFHDTCNLPTTQMLSYQTNTNKVRVRWKISKVRPKNTGELVVPFLVRVDELSLEN